MDPLRAAAGWETSAVEAEANGQDATDIWLTVPVAAAGFLALRPGATADDVARSLRHLLAETNRDDRYRHLSVVLGPTVDAWERVYRRAVAECVRIGYDRKAVDTLLAAIDDAEQGRLREAARLPALDPPSRGLGQRRRLEWKGAKVL